jgi:8-oxo-dGTP pyrophosphatase MutT (NUDIX family)
METVSRPAVRVLCFDAEDRVLLMRWRDPHDGSLLWEPPGGGIEPGETPLEAARRELAEETGLDTAAIRPEYQDVHRDTVWKGRRFTGPEQFFTAFYPGSRPALSPDNLLPYEVAELIECRWVHPRDLAALPDRLDPPNLPGLVADALGA